MYCLDTLTTFKNKAKHLKFPKIAREAPLDGNRFVFEVSNVFSLIVTMEDFYETLGVDKNATLKEIKQAYRKLALQMHPDKQTEQIDKDECVPKFIKILKAFQTLSDQS